MNWLNYHHLYYFRAIAQEGSIAKASEKLRIGQPSLSAQLKLLEDQLGKKLFERRNRKLVLTDSGAEALKYANEIFKMGEEMVEVLKDKTIDNKIHLQVGALDSVPKNVVSALVMQAYKTAPCSVSILEGKGDELMRELRAHKIDLILSNYPAEAGEDTAFYSRSIAKMPVFIYGAKKYQKLKNNFPQSLSGMPIVLPTVHSKLRHDMDHFFSLNKIEINKIAETQDSSLQRSLAENELGLAPFSSSQDEKHANIIKIGKLHNVFEEIWLISSKRKLENPVAKSLMKAFALKI